MQVEIYADIVFLINFAMDFLIFWIVSKLVKYKVNMFRLIGGAFTASILYCLLIFIPFFRTYYNFFSSMVILMLGIVIVFGVSNVWEFFKLVFLSHISAFAVGGLGIALFYYTNITNLIGNMLGYTIEYFSLKILLVSACAAYIILKLGIGFVQRVLLKKQVFYTVRIHFKNKNADLTALVDTGNTLRDPVSKSPVIIAEFKSIKQFLPEKLKLLFYENRENDLTSLATMLQEADMATSIRMIPYKSLGKENGMLIGFKPDKVELCRDNKDSFMIDNVIIGIYNLSLSENGEYQGLINPALIEPSS